VRKRELLKFLLKALFIGAPLCFAWMELLSDEYLRVLYSIGHPLLDFLGVKKWWMALLMFHFATIVAYVTLVLATPGLLHRIGRNIAGLGAGLAIVIIMHLILVYAVYFANFEFGLRQTFHIITLPLYLINDILPFALWLLWFPQARELFFETSFVEAEQR
jgi:hypothetical protein